MRVRRRAAKALTVQRLDTGCTFRGSNPDEGEIFSNRALGPHPASCTMGTEGKVVRAWHGVDHPPVPSSTEVKEKEELYLCSPPVPP